MIKPLNKKQCELLLNQNYIGDLSYIYQNRPFVVPITYLYKDDRIICYSGEGHKITAMRLHEPVSIGVSEITSIKQWKSVVAHGNFEELEGPDAKALLHEFSLGVKDAILQAEHNDLNFISEFSARIKGDDIPIVFVINIDELTGRMSNDSQ
ncbi:flavin mononucleotide-binding protein [Subsaximicrobium wynnwilliamsii]|uniref:Flavin mononucleotide-binding protein n=1 Tax=Subsaximicrobium wynnwilliamsii TaxID=291179 RepID=A0A5C6ZHF1_9FLAO|nr:pyridoxamine 5'-phosphate oxidase family protein [Subsaximicrobium wynnwilliamsii]TXD83061.1 flavin mononucleotide-binding protein [Subsaximicrobium wynnwilliamsii]TXD88805.1 flavin mononucleotide-binding protein [Subsaximicrobium wynnwilliamsii]TXE02878.1 flavin mononucleotide-binding protein [Subsaximicrobium wynnwilliamsii]